MANSGTAIYFVHSDHLGSPQALTDQSGTVAWAADYEPFGDVLETVTTVSNNLRFPGQYFDEETRLHYNYFRDYDPGTGKYVQSDPIGIGGGPNTYSYVRNNRVRLSDRLGLEDVGVDSSFGTGGEFAPVELTSRLSGSLLILDLTFESGGRSGLGQLLLPDVGISGGICFRSTDVCEFDDPPVDAITGRRNLGVTFLNT